MTRTAWVNLFHHSGVTLTSPFAVLPARGPVHVVRPQQHPTFVESPFSAGPTSVSTPARVPSAEVRLALVRATDATQFAVDEDDTTDARSTESEDLNAWQIVWENIDRARVALRRASETDDSADRKELWSEAAHLYREVRDLVGRPSGCVDTPLARFLKEIRRGDTKLNQLQTEAVLEFALFSPPEYITEVLDDVSILGVRIEKRLGAIKERLTKIHRNRFSQDRLSGRERADEFTSKAIEKRIRALREELEANAEKRAPWEWQRRELGQAYEEFKVRREPIEEKLRAMGTRIQTLEQQIKKAKSITPLFALMKKTRQERKKLHEAWSDDLNELKGLKSGMPALARQRAVIDGEIDECVMALREVESLLDDLFAERTALYAEEDALQAALDGDTDWIKVFESKMAEQERAFYKTRLAEASALMRFAAHADTLIQRIAERSPEQSSHRSSSFVQRVKHFELVEKMARSLLNDLYSHADDRHYEIRLYAQMLLMESMARQTECAFSRKDNRSLKSLLSQLDLVVSGVLSEVEDGRKPLVSLLADHLHDIVQLMYRMGLVDRAMAYAHILTASPGYRDTQAARTIIQSDCLRPYLDDTGKFIRRPDALSNRHWVQRLREAIPQAGYGRRFVEPMASGFAAVAAAMGLDYAMTGALSVGIPAAAAAGATTLVRLWNGWNSSVAVSAGRTGELHKTSGDTLKDVLWFGARGAAGFAGWAVPTWMIATVGQPEAQAALASAFDNVQHAWGHRVPSMITSALPTATHSGTLSVAAGLDVARLLTQNGIVGYDFAGRNIVYNSYAALEDAVPWKKALTWMLPPAAVLAGLTGTTDDLRNLYYLYMASAGGLYGAYTFVPSWRAELRNKAWMFIPGAIALGAHVGLQLRGEDEWSRQHFWRLSLGSAALLESIAMLLMTGTIPLPFLSSSEPGTADLRGRARHVGIQTQEFARAMSRGIRYDANHMFMVAIAMSVGISSALGGVILQDIHRYQNSAPVIAMLGAMTSLALLPMPLLMSGILKQQIPIIPGIEEALKETEGQGAFRRTAAMLQSGVYAFTSPYVWNRIGRVPTLDLPAAFVRTLLGWDSILGYLPFMVINAVFGNPTASMMRPETAGTPWQHDPLTALLDKHQIDQEKLINHWRKSAQQLSIWHFFQFYGHGAQGMRDWAYPFFGIRRIWHPPEFPLKRQRHYLAEFFLYLTGQTAKPHTMTPTKLRTLLHEIENIAKNPAHFATVRPLIQVLYMAKAPDTHLILSRNEQEVALERTVGDELRLIIREWFAENPWVIKHMYLNTDELEPVRGGAKRDQRRLVRAAVKESRAAYVRVVDTYHNRDKRNLAAGLFQ